MKQGSVHWRAPEFLYRKKTLLWYTNVSVFFFIVMMLFLYTNNWPGVGITALLFLFFISRAKDRPEIIDYKIDATGVTVGERQINFSDIHSFSVDKAHDQPLILLDMNYSFSMPATLLLKEKDVEAVVSMLQDAIPQRKNYSLIRWLTHRLHY